METTDQAIAAAQWQITKDLFALVTSLVSQLQTLSASHHGLVEVLRTEAGYESKPAPIVDAEAMERARVDIAELDAIFNAEAHDEGTEKP